MRIEKRERKLRWEEKKKSDGKKDYSHYWRFFGWKSDHYGNNSDNFPLNLNIPTPSVLKTKFVYFSNLKTVCIQKTVCVQRQETNPTVIKTLTPYRSIELTSKLHSFSFKTNPIQDKT